MHISRVLPQRSGRRVLYRTRRRYAAMGFNGLLLLLMILYERLKASGAPPKDARTLPSLADSARATEVLCTTSWSTSTGARS
jgi:hypothetical protein